VAGPCGRVLAPSSWLCAGFLEIPRTLLLCMLLKWFFGVTVMFDDVAAVLCWVRVLQVLLDAAAAQHKAAADRAARDLAAATQEAAALRARVGNRLCCVGGGVQNCLCYLLQGDAWLQTWQRCSTCCSRHAAQSDRL